VPQVKHLRTFGCVAYIKDLSHLKKLDDRSCPGIFIGYADGAKAYRVLDPETQRVRVSRDVVFDESRGWDWIKAGGRQAPADEEFVVERVEEFGSRGARTLSSGLASTPAASRSPSSVLSPGEQSSARAEEEADTLLQASPIMPAAGSSAPIPPIELATPLEDDEDRLDAYYDAEPLRYRTVTNIVGDEPPPGMASRHCAQLHLTHAGEPTNHVEARGHPACEAAMKQEL
jgi:hypothetical protein